VHPLSLSFLILLWTWFILITIAYLYWLLIFVDFFNEIKLRNPIQICIAYLEKTNIINIVVVDMIYFNFFYLNEKKETNCLCN